MRMLCRTVPGALCCGLWLAAPAPAQTVEPFYRGRTITLLVGTSPGGINDISARLVARHLGRHIPGNPGFVVQNNPGAGGLVTANRIYNTAEKDGTVLAKIERAVPQLQIQGDRGCRQITGWIGMSDTPPNSPAVAYLNVTDQRCCFGEKGKLLLEER